MSEIRAGYKQTEIGVIPEDWEIHTVGSIAEYINGKAHEGDISKNGAFIVVNSRFISTNGKVAKRSNVQFSPAFKDDVLMVMSDVPNGKAIARSFFVDENNVYTVNQRICILRAVQVDALLLFYKINRNPFYLAFDDGAKQTNLRKEDVLSCPLALPKTAKEQRSIATALNDVDTLINSQDALIAKKRNIKQAVMQQLLTGKQRLPGFSEKWVAKQLGDFGVTYGGLTGKTKADFGTGPAQYIPFMNIMSNVAIDTSDFASVRVSANESQNQAQKGDLFFNGSSETPEEVGMCAVLLEDIQNVYLNSFCFGFRLYVHSKIDGKYLAYFFRSGSGRDLLYSMAQGATRYNLSKVSLLKLEFKIPSLEEQVAIAKVLSDMDAEITALESQRNKTKLLKQGMMQELLTGRTRLI